MKNFIFFITATSTLTWNGPKGPAECVKNGISRFHIKTVHKCGYEFGSLNILVETIFYIRFIILLLNNDIPSIVPCPSFCLMSSRNPPKSLMVFFKFLLNSSSVWPTPSNLFWLNFLIATPCCKWRNRDNIRRTLSQTKNIKVIYIHDLNQSHWRIDLDRRKSRYLTLRFRKCRLVAKCLIYVFRKFRGFWEPDGIFQAVLNMPKVTTYATHSYLYNDGLINHNWSQFIVKMRKCHVACYIR